MLVSSIFFKMTSALELSLHRIVSFIFTKQSQLLTTLRKKPIENIVGKGENAGN